jgi:oligosaccharide repeat unit polymerase
MPALYLILASILCAVFVRFMFRGGLTLGTAGGWVVVTCIHGLLMKPLFVSFDIPSAAILDDLLFDGVTREEYWIWGTISLVAYALFFLTMVLVGRYRKPVRSQRRSVEYWNWRLALFLLVGLVGVLGYFAQFPDLLLGVSKNSIAANALDEYNSGGIWINLANFAYVVSICALVNVGAGVARRRSWLLFCMAVLLWIPFCYLSDQRGLMLFTVVTYVVAYSQFIRPLSKKSIALAMFTTIALLVVRTLVRFLAGGSDLRDTAAQTLANVVGQNFVEHSKMIAIVKAIPDVLDFQYGYSYLNAILVLIPRSFFPDKPFVNLDTTIGQAVFGCQVYGACAVPPGLLGESFLNFGVPGVFLMPILMGILVGAMDLRFRMTRPGNTYQVLYLMSGLYIGMGILGSGVASSITQLIVQAVAVTAVCFTCRRSFAPSRARGGFSAPVEGPRNSAAAA